MATVFSYFPYAYSTSYVKATSYYTGYSHLEAARHDEPVTGGYSGWLSAGSSVTNQKFNIDLGAAKVINGIYIENQHHAGTYTDTGLKNFTLYGTNSSTAFDNTTYSDTTDLTSLGTFQADEHPATDTADPQYFTFSNSTAYRYYVLRIADNWGSTSYVGARRISVYYTSPLTTRYPTSYSADTVKATSTYNTNYYPHFTFDPSKSITGGASDNQWFSGAAQSTNQKLNVDLGGKVWPTRIYLVNSQSTGATEYGIQDFTVYGTNSATAFNNTTYSDTTDLTSLGSFTAAQHCTEDRPDHQFFTITGAAAYRYIVFRISNNYGGSFMGVRRLEVQFTENLIEGDFNEPFSTITSDATTETLIWGRYTLPFLEVDFDVTTEIQVSAEILAPSYSVDFDVTTEILLWTDYKSPRMSIYSEGVTDNLIYGHITQYIPVLYFTFGWDSGVVSPMPIIESTCITSYPMYVEMTAKKCIISSSASQEIVTNIDIHNPKTRIKSIVTQPEVFELISYTR